MKNVLVTGGAGFIGSNFIKHLFNSPDFKGIIVNIDKLTYAGNLDNLKDIEELHGGELGRYIFEHFDINQTEDIFSILYYYNIDTIINFAAETHVDNSITGPKEFIDTNINGTFSLLEAVRRVQDKQKIHFHHVSTDEVFGSLGDTGYFTEETAYDPRSPYSASKAASDHLVKAYYHTYGIPITISNCSNNYGPYQYPEKLIPVIIDNIINERPLPVYGDGMNIRDWLYVDDHCSAILNIITTGIVGDTYNVGGDNEWTNIDLVNTLCEKIAVIKGKDVDYYKKLITYVTDRAGHDKRYAIDCLKLKYNLGWKQTVDFTTGLDKTVEWYLDNTEWINNIKNKIK